MNPTCFAASVKASSRALSSPWSWDCTFLIIKQEHILCATLLNYCNLLHNYCNLLHNYCNTLHNYCNLIGLPKIHVYRIQSRSPGGKEWSSQVTKMSSFNTLLQQLLSIFASAILFIDLDSFVTSHFDMKWSSYSPQ